MEALAPLRPHCPAPKGGGVLRCRNTQTPQKMNEQAQYLEKFSRAYKVAALWSSTDDQGEPMDKGRDLDDIHPDTHTTMDKDCEAFVAEQWADLKDLDPEQCGHDFWLTRNGHGAGFWDRGLEEVGERLSAACGWKTKHPQVDLYIGDDGMVHA